jgi:hypothetical protein|nr:MAG TPA: hypothetical protein [Caudoviricetes sp.]
MKYNPYKQIKFFIDKNNGMLKAFVPDVIKNDVSIEIDDHEMNITIK